MHMPRTYKRAVDSHGPDFPDQTQTWVPIDIAVWMSYLDDVSSKGAPKPLLFGVVELIVGQIPSIFNLWLGHILDTSKKEPNMTHIIHFPNTLFFYSTSFPYFPLTCWGSSLMTPVFPNKMRLFFSAVSFLFSLEGEWEALSSFSSGISGKTDQRQMLGSMYTSFHKYFW